jgi:acyl-CoA synthetase (AMP-forming)/AMP-acid ligase II
MVKLLILSGQRRGEVAGMEWSELDLENSLWTLPSVRTKNGRVHSVALSRDALAVIKGLPRISEVARPDEKWGETPCAFVQLRPGTTATADEIIDFCRGQLAHYKAPKSVVFGPLPTTAAGKIQKFVLRERARAK